MLTSAVIKYPRLYTPPIFDCLRFNSCVQSVQQEASSQHLCVSSCKCYLSIFPLFITILSTMLDEISAAVLFLVRLIEKSENFKQEQLDAFKAYLSEFLAERFENHWFPEQPFKGQGYRCIRVNERDRRDATLERAAIACGFKYEDLKLPVELTLWVDPNEVCCRFGEHRGSYCTLASFSDAENDSALNQLKKIGDIVMESKLNVAPLSMTSPRNSKRRSHGSGSKNSPRGGTKSWGQGQLGFQHSLPPYSWHNLLPQQWLPPSPPPYPQRPLMRSSQSGKWGGTTGLHHRYNWQTHKPAALKV